MFAKCSVLLAVSFVLAAARPSPPSGHVQHERREVDGSRWAKGSRIDGEMVVPVRIGLTQSNIDEGDGLLMAISDPASPRYGQHLSADEVLDFFAPSQERVDTVTAWLKASGNIVDRPISLSYNKQWLQFEAPISHLEDLLHTQYHEYEHSTTGDTTLGCDAYHVPSYLHEHIDYITPGVKAVNYVSKRSANNTGKRSVAGGRARPIITPVPLTQIQAAQANSDCGFAITPHCIRLLYNVTDTLTQYPGNSLGVYEYANLYNQRDLNEYFSQFATDIPQGTHPQFDPVDGAVNPANAPFTGGGEADLDFQAAYPLVYPDEIELYQVDDRYYTEAFKGGLFNTFLDALDGSYCNFTAFGETGDNPTYDPVYPDKHKGGYKGPLECGRYTPTNVISISYSIDEPDLPQNYQRRQCLEFMKLGLQGVSIIVSSGDSGVGEGEDNNICKMDGELFNPQDPTNCPYITAVGATYLPPGSIAGQDPEAATTQFGSSGGFSNIYPRPSYQSKALDFFFTNYPPPYGYYNTTYDRKLGPGRYNRGGRGFPDVAATGQSFAAYFAGAPNLVDGTSVSTPVVASMITRINSARLAAGKKPVGFLNPVFYSNPDLFNDIITGDNPGCLTAGFSCVPGWDPVTGLGTPNYGKLKEMFLSLP